jgi:hypothetical protein
MTANNTPGKRFTAERAFTILLFVGFCAYFIMAVGLAGFLLYNAFVGGMHDFEEVGLGAIIAVLGTGLTAFAAVYGAQRQALVARQVEILKRDTGTELARLSSDLTRDIEGMKAASAQSLQRLGVHLNSVVTAYRDLFGAAAVYFYALRSAGAAQTWDGGPLAKAQEGMIEATRQLIYVSQEMNDRWLHFWQDAEFIYWTALGKETDGVRRASIRTEMARKNPQKGGQAIDFQDLFAALEVAARSAIEKEMRVDV